MVSQNTKTRKHGFDTISFKNWKDDVVCLATQGRKDATSLHHHGLKSAHSWKDGKCMSLKIFEGPFL